MSSDSSDHVSALKKKETFLFARKDNERFDNMKEASVQYSEDDAEELKNEVENMNAKKLFDNRKKKVDHKALNELDKKRVEQQGGEEYIEIELHLRHQRNNL